MVEAILEKILPLDVLAPIILGLLIYALIVFFGLSPVVAERTATITLRPACLAWVDRLDGERIAARETERRAVERKREKIRAAARAKFEAAKEEIERARRMAGRIFQGPLGNFLQQLHGGDIVDQAFSQVPMPRLPSDAELKLPHLPDRLSPASPVAQRDKCGCVVNRALQETRVEFAVYTGTLRAFTPARVASLRERMKDIAVSPQCRAG